MNTFLRNIGSIVALLFVLSCTHVRADILLTENFSTGILPTGWTNTAIQGAQTWSFQNAPVMTSPSGGFYAVFDDLALGAGTFPNEAVLSTPSINCSNRTNVKVSYYHHWFGVENTHGYVEVSNDGGTTWNTIIDYEKLTRGSLATPQDTILDISAFAANQPDVRVRFRYTDGSQAGRYWYLDDLVVYADPDVGVIGLIAPPYLGCGQFYGTTEQVTVQIYNYGVDTVSSVPVTCVVSDGTSATLTGTYIGNIPPRDTVTYTFATTVDLTTDTSYQFTSYTTYVGDEYLYNDTFIVGRHQHVTNFPFFEDFDNSNGGWLAGGSTTKYWNWGPLPTGYLGGAAGNGSSWYIESDGTSTYQDLWLESPVFDLSGLTNPMLLFDLKYDLTYDWCDRAVYVQYSTDDGTTWTTLGANTAPLWYNSGANTCWPNTWSGNAVNSWTQVQHSLCDLIGETCVKFRFYGDDIRYSDMFALDNIIVREWEDVGVIAYLEPVNLGCLFNANQEVTIAVYNWACSPMTNVPVTCEITGPNPTTLTGTVPGPIPANDSVHFTFPSTFDMTAVGLYGFTSYTTLGTDNNLNNDTLTTSINVNQLKVATFPYNEDFNADDGYWIAGGGDANNYWNWAALPAGYLGGPAGYGNSWYVVKDGTATYHDMWLESPVFDFSQITNPIFSMDVKYDLAYDWCDRAVHVQYSIDGGTTWTTLGTNADPNWYDSGTNTCWPNTWSATTVGTWTKVQHDLCVLSGENCVKLRIYADDIRYSDRFALDNVQVTDGEGDDVEPLVIYPPNSGVCAPFTNAETITVLIQNNNCRPLTNLPITFNLTGPNTATLTDTVPGPIPAFGRFDFTFANTVDMSGTGTYNLQVTTGSNTSGIGWSYINDTMPANNTIIETRYSNTPLSTFPYTATFDAGNEGWASGRSLVNRYWDWDALPAGYLGGPGGNVESCFMVSDGSSTYSDLWVESPIFDFTGLVNPMLTMDIKYDLTYDWCDRAVYVQYSTNGGTSWTTLGTNADPGWYAPGSNTCWPNTWSAGVVSEWTQVQHTLCNLVGETCVKFRVYADDIRYSDMFAFDNFTIHDTIDVGVIAFIDPVDVGCLFGVQQEVTVAVYNWSCTALSNVPVVCEITGPNSGTLTGTIPGPIPPNDSVHFTFPTTFDMTTMGTYNFVAYTDMTNDGNHANDTLTTSINVNQLKVATFPYNEDFNADDGYWIAGGGDANNYWNWAALPAGYLGGPAGYGNSWYVVKDGTATYHDMWLESPVFDFSQITNPIFSMDVKYDLAYDWCDRAVHVQYSIDGGTTWTTLGTNADPNWYDSGTNTCWPNTWSATTVGTWTKVQHDLCVLSGENCVKLRIYADDIRYSDRFALDNVQVTDGEGDDVEPLVIYPPNSGVCAPFTNAETITVLIQNNNCRPLTNLPITFNLTGPNTATLTDTVPGPIPAFGRFDFTFANTVDMSGTGTYNLQVTTGSNTSGIGWSYINDTMPANNTIIETRYSNTPLSTFPYTATFDAGNEGWASGRSLVNRYWDWDALPAGYLGGPGGNVESCFMVSDGSSTYSDLWVESPIFDFTGLVNPMLTMDIKYDLTYDWCDRAVYVQYSTNGGTSWTTLGTNADPGWYAPGSNTCWPNTWSAGVVSEWTQVQHTLCNLVGETCVKFRVYADDIRYSDMFAFDNFNIEDRTDVGVIAFIEPLADNCLHSANQTVTVEVFNWSCAPVSNVPVVCDITGAATTTLNDVVPGPIPASGSVNFTFTTTFDMTPVGTYDFVAYTDLPLEANRNNDTSYHSVTVNHQLINTFPHYEQFNANSGVGVWAPAAGDANNYWTWGAVPYLGGPGGYGNSWYIVKDGTSTYHDMWLESPVFDFTGLTNPVLNFDLKYDLAYDWCDRAVYIQYTTNGGTTWTTLGTNAEPNWYNSGANTCWPNTWSASTVGSWTNVRRDLCALAGESCVQFRFFADDVRYSDQFAFDNFHITDTPIDAEVMFVSGCYGSTYDLEVTVGNNSYLCVASPNITSIDLSISIDGGAATTQTYTGLNIPYGGTEIIQIPNVNVPTSNSTVQVWCSFPNGLTDQIFENDTATGYSANWPHCNDNCNSAIGLGLGTVTASQTSNATPNPLEDPPFTGCGNPTLENTVWYWFTTDNMGGMVTVTFQNIGCTPSNNGIQVSIDQLTGPPCDPVNYTNVYCANNGNTSDFSWGPVNLPPNTIYYIAVDGYAGNDCDFEIDLSGAVVVLPVELTSFEAACANNGKEVLLRWTTATETNNSHFTLERSEDGNVFEPIATITAIGNSTQTTTYQFTDETPLIGAGYYRLKQTDYNGQSSYAPTVAVDCEPASYSYTIAPNPAKDNLHLQINSPVDQSRLELTLMNEMGKQILKKGQALHQGANRLQLNLSKYASGLYLLKLQIGDQAYFEKVVLAR